MTSNPRQFAVSLVVFLALAIQSGCAAPIPAAPKEERSPSDPWEPMNRHISAFNDNVDRVTLKPIAKGYQAIVPGPIRTGINNFSRNLLGPLYIVNNLLQGKFKRSLSETGRFVANTTWGIGGLIDAGNYLGFETYREDFGQTLAVWGVPDGPYLVLPFFGPKTVRHAVTLPLDAAANPSFYLEDDRSRLSIYFVRTVDLRAELFTAEALIEDSFDRYLSIRESYLQNRQFLIHDGDPPEDDEFYEEFEEEFDEN